MKGSGFRVWGFMCRVKVREEDQCGDQPEAAHCQRARVASGFRIYGLEFRA